MPEYWLVDPEQRTFALLVLDQGQYVPVDADAGRFASTVIPGLVVDPDALLAGLD